MFNAYTAQQLGQYIKKGFRFSVEADELAINPGIHTLTETDKTWFTTHKQALKTWIDQQRIVSLSPQQQRLWYLAQIGQSTHYHVPAIAKLVNTPAHAFSLPDLWDALDILCEQQDSLRMQINAIDAVPYARIYPSAPKYTHYERLFCHIPMHFTDEQVSTDSALQAYIQREFDLTNGPLWRVIIGEDRINAQSSPRTEITTIVFCFHHLICDAWSITQFIDTLANYLNAALSTRPSQPLSQPLSQRADKSAQQRNRTKPAPWQYEGYAAWQQQIIQAPNKYTSESTFWQHYIGDAKPLNLNSFALSAQTHTQNPVIIRQLDGQQYNALTALAKQHDCGEFALCLAAFYLSFASLTQQNDFVVGMPSANRTRPEWQHTFGFFVNTLVLRLYSRQNDTLSDVINRFSKDLGDIQSQQNYPIERLVNLSRQDQHTSTPGPLFNVLVNYTPTLPGQVTLGDSEFKPVFPRVSQAKFDLTVSFIASDDPQRPFFIVFEYDTQRFRHQQAKTWLSTLMNEMDNLTTNADKQVETWDLQCHSDAPAASQNIVNPQKHYSKEAITLAERSLPIWKDTLQKNELHIEDSFFTVGGHSMLAVQLTDRLNDAALFTQPINTLDMLRYATPIALADFVLRSQVPEQDSITRITPQNTSEQSNAVFVQQQIDVVTLHTPSITLIVPGFPGFLHGYQQLIEYIKQEAITDKYRYLQQGTVIGLAYDQLIFESETQSIQEQCQHFIKTLTKQLTSELLKHKTQCINIVAHSFGASLISAVLAQLPEMNIQLDHLVIIDAVPHNHNPMKTHTTDVNSDHDVSNLQAQVNETLFLQLIQFSGFSLSKYESALTLKVTDSQGKASKLATFSPPWEHLYANFDTSQVNRLKQRWVTLQTLLNMSFEYPKFTNSMQTGGTQNSSFCPQHVELLIASDSKTWLDDKAWNTIYANVHARCVDGNHMSLAERPTWLLD